MLIAGLSTWGGARQVWSAPAYRGGASDAEAGERPCTPLAHALIAHPNKQATVDVLGVVLSLGSAGTVKRKADNSELPRR